MSGTLDPQLSWNLVRDYQQLLEFYVGEDAAVERLWAFLVGAGYHGRMPPTQTAGPYAAMVDDPDGNIALLTSDEAARIHPDGAWAPPGSDGEDAGDPGPAQY